MSFAAAAQHWGLDELRSRFPGVPEAALKEVLPLPLEVLKHTLDRLVPLGNVEPTLRRLVHKTA